MTAARVVEGAIIGLFEIDKYRTSDKEQKVIDRLVVVVDGADKEALSRGVKRGQIVGEAVNFTRDMANEPGAYLTPTNMAERAQEIAKEFNLTSTCSRSTLAEEGMGSHWLSLVGQTSLLILIILKYTPAETREG